jgi:uncharacterized protein (TIGR04168 family)
VRIAVLGDLHGCFDGEDAAALDARGVDLVCVVGDLGGALHLDTLAVARRLAALRTPAVAIPGNHDATSPLGVLAEALGVGRARPGAGRRGALRADALRRALGPVVLGGYSLHPAPAHGVTVIAARPHAMEPRWLPFAPALDARFGVSTLTESGGRLCSLVDRAEGDLVFLAHNGPAGLGAGPRAPFSLRGRDLGDPDLALALAHARRRGRRVRAVVAGHLHHRGADRDWHVVHEGVVVVNAARVPRWAPDGRHHVELDLGADPVAVRAIVLPSPRIRW